MGVAPARRSRILRWAAGIAAVGVITLGGAGAACKFALNCGLREGDPFIGAGGEATGATRLADGLEQDVVASGLELPTSFAFLPDGGLLVAEKAGRVLSVEEGRAPEVVLDISDRVSNHSYRGLLAIEPAPDFEESRELVVLYVRGVEPVEAPTTVRVSRFTLRGDAAGSEVALVGSADEPCGEGPAGAPDCIPCDQDHCGGDLEFAADGSLFVSTGDGWWGAPGAARHSLRAQSLDSLAGKLLRLSPDGEGLEDNPFWDGDAASARSRVWAYGFRNPFRLTLRPGHGTPVLGDVGWDDWEEIDAVEAGGNYGWPCYEGESQPPEYRSFEECVELVGRGPQAVRAPLVVHENGSVTGGVFWDTAAAPSRLRGAYVYGDWSWSWLRALDVDAAGRAGGEGEELAEQAAGPVQFGVGPDGALYYLAANAGELRRVRSAG